MSHTSGEHAFKFGVNFIHEPVLSGAFPGKYGNALYSRKTPLTTSPILRSYHGQDGWEPRPQPREAPSRKTFSGWRYMRRILARNAASDGELWPALWDEFWAFYGIRAQPAG